MPKRNPSWFRLVTFCTTGAIIAGLAFAILIASATLAFAVVQARKSSHYQATSPGAQTFSGMITDSNCGARHAQDSGKSPAECVRACVRKGAKYVLVDGEKAYFLEGSSDALDKFAGQRATISGAREGSTLRVSSVAAQ